MARKTKGYTISAPGIDRNGFTEPQVAMSAAINVAQRTPRDTTVYVRDADGDSVGYVYHDVHGVLYVHTRKEGK
jgi:hypothetical protein